MIGEGTDLRLICEVSRQGTGSAPRTELSLFSMAAVAVAQTAVLTGRQVFGGCGGPWMQMWTRSDRTCGPTPLTLSPSITVDADVSTVMLSFPQESGCHLPDLSYLFVFFGMGGGGGYLSKKETWLVSRTDLHHRSPDVVVDPAVE